jgi:hypothetical protein
LPEVPEVRKALESWGLAIAYVQARMARGLPLFICGFPDFLGR